ncbi:tyrosine-type recombinase/integrase [Arthrobacter sp. KN11-1C]|uniref:tyrosine-type recombinase/integrase n=1 Tax=Arthrobacter sp. KN11-1C TaxID=3445774 RepID=UPI003FA12EFA
MGVKKLENGKYQVDYRIDGKRIFKRFSTLRAAKEYFQGVEAAKAGGTLIDTRKSGKMRFHDLYQEWIQRIETSGAGGARPASPVTVAGYRRIYTTHIQPHFENRPLAQITLPVVNEWLKTFRSDDSRRRSYRQLGRMLQHAVDRGYIATNIARNPTVNNIPTPEPVREGSALTAGQLRMLAGECARGGRYDGKSHESYGLLILFAGTTGLRWSEIAGLRTASLTLGARSEVRVQSTLVPVDGRQQLRETTKGRRPRTVPIPQTVASVLANHIEGASDGALVFTSPSGRELRASNFARRVFHPAIERCQAADSTFPRIVFHDLRRTAVSLAISGNANVKVVQQIAGHKSAVTTMDVYAHYYEDDLHSSAQAVDRMLSAG